MLGCPYIVEIFIVVSILYNELFEWNRTALQTILAEEM